MINVRLILALLSFAGFVGSIGTVYFKGRADGRAQCASAQYESELKGVDRHESIKRGVMGLDSSELDRALSNWLRSDE